MGVPWCAAAAVAICLVARDAMLSGRGATDVWLPMPIMLLAGLSALPCVGATLDWARLFRPGFGRVLFVCGLVLVGFLVSVQAGYLRWDIHVPWPSFVAPAYFLVLVAALATGALVLVAERRWSMRVGFAGRSMHLLTGVVRTAEPDRCVLEVDDALFEVHARSNRTLRRSLSSLDAGQSVSMLTLVRWNKDAAAPFRGAIQATIVHILAAHRTETQLHRSIKRSRWFLMAIFVVAALLTFNVSRILAVAPAEGGTAWPSPFGPPPTTSGPRGPYVRHNRPLAGADRPRWGDRLSAGQGSIPVPEHLPRGPLCMCWSSHFAHRPWITFDAMASLGPHGIKAPGALYVWGEAS